MMEPSMTPRGWCPSVLQPMPTGDGLLVRIQPRSAELSMRQLQVVAEAAHQDGNGVVELTRRGNLQIRGIAASTLERLQQRLSAAGLLDLPTPAGAVRNVTVSPLAGWDPAEVMDVRALARSLRLALENDTELARLPAKFSFVVDGGGQLVLDAVRADIRLKVQLDARHRQRVYIGIADPAGARWVSITDPLAAVDAALAWAKAALRAAPEAWGTAAPTLPATRMRRTGTMPARPTPSPGLVMHDGEPFAVAIGVAFGTVDAKRLASLAALFRATGIDQIRLSPWRMIYAPINGRGLAISLLRAAEERGFIVSARAPTVGIEACAGAPACAAARGETRGPAHQLAGMRGALPGVATIHVSGCAKGCARSLAADLVLRAAPGGYHVIVDGRADGAPMGYLAQDRVRELPALLAGRARVRANA